MKAKIIHNKYEDGIEGQSNFGYKKAGQFIIY